MADATLYNPSVAFRIKISKVYQLTEVGTDPATYRLSYTVEGLNDLGAMDTVLTSYYLVDYIGVYFSILVVGSGTLDVEDSFRTGECPTSNENAIIAKSVGAGDAPFLSPSSLQFLHPLAKDNINRWNLDILWKKLYDETYVTDPAKWLRNTFASVLEFGVAIGQDNLVEGERSLAIGQGHNTKSFMETILGAYALVATGQTSDDWIPTDFLLTLGNGADANNRSNALEIYKSGLVKFYNSVLIGAYSNGAVDPVDGILQYTAQDGLQIWDTNAWTGIGGGTFTYTAYASDDQGTDFTLTNDTDLAYMAVLVSPVEIPTPVVGDFAGLWRGDIGVRVAFDFITSDELFFIYKCPQAMVFTSQEYETVEATLDPPLNTPLAQYDTVELNVTDVGMSEVNAIVPVVFGSVHVLSLPVKSTDVAAYIGVCLTTNVKWSISNFLTCLIG